MTSEQNSHSSPIHNNQIDPSSIMIMKEPDVLLLSSSSTAILMDYNSDSSPNKPCLVDDYCKFHYVSNRKQAAAKQISPSYLRHRLCVRHHFVVRLYVIYLCI